ncbi:MAG TPA: hypothetical protein VNT75_03485 [Symbiobacteriaceae bacterium]|nr:hypothetical protein [Symbiobacteriaceae bacterium]
MQGRNSYEDELARRRRLRERQAAAEEGGESEGGEGEIPHFGWKDILAMCIAAYQIIFPILLALIGAMILAYLLFKWVFAS